MRERGSSEEDYNRKYAEHLIGKDGDYKCAKCKKIWIPTDADINRKAMMTYYKCCSSCRLCLYNREAERKLLIRIAEAEAEDALRTVRPFGRTEAEWAT
jgi:hypothetical protein